MDITRFECNMISENCYLIADANGEAALIDCGALYDEERKAISSTIEKKHLHLVRVLNTHAHFDHVFGLSYIYKEYGIKPQISEDETHTYETAFSLMKEIVRMDIPVDLPPLGETFRHGDELKVGTITLRVIATPGHTPGGVCFYSEADKVLFSGDSLFRHEIGRCDLPGGDSAALVSSLRERVLSLPDDVMVLPGHGDATTVGEERQHNPYVAPF